MDLNTRCPYCETVFSASLEQLQLRKGYIRCVQCAHIFDGYEHVVPGDAGSGAQVAPRTPPVTPVNTPPEPRLHSMQAPRRSQPSPVSRQSAPSPTSPPSATSPLAEPSPPSAPASAPHHSSAPAPSVVRRRREFTISDPVDLPASAEPYLRVNVEGMPDGPAVRRRDAPPAKPASTPYIGDLDGEMSQADAASDGLSAESREPGLGDPAVIHVTSDPAMSTPTPGSDEYSYASFDGALSVRPARSGWQWLATIVWSLLIALAALLLVGQLAYVFRVQLAERVPAMRPGLEKMCAALDCTVAWPRHIDMIVVSHSALHHEAAGDDGDEVDTVVLQFTLRNVYEHAQEWPTMVLELKDFAGATVARKHLPKEVYLPPDQRDLPFPAGSEYAVTLPLTLHGLKVNGYQLSKFFP